MADTRHLHVEPAPLGPVEGDGISYSGIVWFVVVLTVTTVFCQVLVWGMFRIMQSRYAAADTARAPLSMPIGQHPPPPNLLTDEPGNLKLFRARETETLTTYGWADKNAGAVRIPIDQAKKLLIERGLPVRGAAPTPTPGVKTK
jgi:hypothetical protein